MKAMILAAGRGERMRPLTDQLPKPLLPVAGKPLIQYTLEKLSAAGFNEIIINLAYRGQQIKDALGDGQKFGVHIAYSDEGETALETAGGIIKALPLLGPAPFVVINGDIASDFPLKSLHDKPFDLAHLIMMDNPPHHPQGDFALDKNGQLSEQGSDKLTFSGIGLYSPELFESFKSGPLKLRPVFQKAMRKQRISGEKYQGFWMDIGTPQRLIELEQHIVNVSITSA